MLIRRKLACDQMRLTLISFTIRNLYNSKCLQFANQTKSNQMLVFGEREKPEYPEKNLWEQSREPTNSTHIWHRGRGEREKPEYPEKKPLGAEKRTNKLNPHVTPRERGEGKTGVTGEKPLGAEKRTNKLNPHMTPRERGEGKTGVPGEKPLGAE